MSEDRIKVLAVFPELQGANPGGVQVSGQIAWAALQRETDARALMVNGRVSAIKQAWRTNFPADVVLFWHLDLLRLAPLLPAPGRRVLFLHGIEAWRRPDPLQRWLLRRTALLANSEFTAARARASIPGIRYQPIQVVPLGMGTPADATPSGQPPAAIMIGRLDGGERYKGHHEVIRAWTAVTRRVAGAQLWIVGDGDLRSELETFVDAHGSSDSIRFFGRVSESEKESLLRAARCLVLPSRAEGFGLVYLEAMRLGRPCLVGRDAGAEVIDPPEGGLSVEPSDIDAVTDAICELLLHGADWEQSALHRYREHYTAAQFQDRLLQSLKSLA